jgi:ribosomal protein S18 acetylase RimI-like enzyme
MAADRAGLRRSFRMIIVAIMTLTFRDAVEADLPAIVAMLADDMLGAQREAPSLPLAPSYSLAFEAVSAAPNQRLIVAISGDEIVGTMQLLMIPGLSRQGSWRGQIEAVRIAAEYRGRGYGEQFVRWAVEECRTAGCTSVQLTSDNSRSDAHRFWRRGGFTSTHLGFKMGLAG